jgi:hypothetical protein
MRGFQLLARDIFQAYTEFLAAPDQPAYGVMRVPECHSPGGQEVRKLGGEREATGGV